LCGSNFFDEALPKLDGNEVTLDSGVKIIESAYIVCCSIFE
jgi:hypothetical protein